MIDKVSGKVAYAVLSFGGFMGIGVKHIPVRWDRMKYGVSLDAYEINLSDEELSRAPSFEADKEFDWGYRDVIGSLNFYRTPPYWGVWRRRRFGLSVIPALLALKQIQLQSRFADSTQGARSLTAHTQGS
jgi:hypothetical protein